MRLKPIIWIIQLVMELIFLIFSFVPLILALQLIYSQVFQTYSVFYLLLMLLFFLLGLIAIYGIFTLKLGLRIYSTIYFSLGIIFGLNSIYISVLGVVLCWLFFETWHIVAKYRQLDEEYTEYPDDSWERTSLFHLFQTQLLSLGFLAWITISVSWGILILTSTFFIEVGMERGFGTLGISITFAMFLLLFLVQKYLSPRKS